MFKDRQSNKLANTIALEKVDEHGKPTHPFKACQSRHTKKPCVVMQDMEVSSDPDDDNYNPDDNVNEGASPASISDDETPDIEVSNAEVSTFCNIVVLGLSDSCF